jgi:hypothetical protein
LTEPATGEAAGGLSVGRYRFLRYWSVNVWLAQRGGWSFPGFAYTEADVTRLKALADAASGTAVMVWLAATVVIYIALAAGLVTAAFSALSVLVPNPADVPAAGFFGGLILAVAGMLVLGLPLSITLGGWIADKLAGAPPPQSPGDLALASKVGEQFLRMGLIVGVLMAASVAGWTWLLRGR